jgi:hypothetical protein
MCRRWVSSRIWRHAVWQIYTDILEEHATSIFRIKHSSSLHTTKCHAGQLHAYLKAFGSILRRRWAVVCNAVKVPPYLQQWPDNCISSYFCIVCCMKHKQVNMHGAPQTARLTALHNLTKRLITSMCSSVFHHHCTGTAHCFRNLTNLWNPVLDKIQGVLKRALQIWKLIEIYTEDIHKVLNCQNVAKHTEFYVG